MAEASCVCSWKFASILDNPIRKLIHNPKKILAEHIEPGQIVLVIVCGPGMFSIAIAQMVGENGKVIAVDVQDD